MRERIVVLAALAIALSEPTLVAAGPWLGEWASEVTLDANATLLSGAESSLDLGYATGPILWTSRSEFRLGVGYLWQEFGVRGVVGPFDVECDALFGPSTTDFLYAQAVAGLRIGGLDVGLFCAVLSDAVLGGPAGGVAVRVGGTFGGLEVVSITELGARIEDEEFDGIDIVHGATGLHRHYATDPVVAGRGITGEKVSVSEAGFGRLPTCAGSPTSRMAAWVLSPPSSAMSILEWTGSGAISR